MAIADIVDGAVDVRATVEVTPDFLISTNGKHVFFQVGRETFRVREAQALPGLIERLKSAVFMLEIGCAEQIIRGNEIRAKISRGQQTAAENAVTA